MSASDGGPIYPPHLQPAYNVHQGVSLRDWLAAKVMCSAIQAGWIIGEGLAERAYLQADAMLKARKT